VPTESATRPPRWHPSLLVGASFAVHAAALGALLARPSVWPWALSGLLADHALLTACGLWPRSDLLGPNLTRLPRAAALRGELAITIDDGPDPQVTPRVLEVLEERGVRATFFCIGERVRQCPELARETAARGHDLENHSDRHLHRFSLLGPRGMMAEIERAQEIIGRAAGRRPEFFRAPAGLRNPFLDPVLSRLGLRLASWTRRGFDTVDSSAKAVLARLAVALGAGDILLLHDGHSARTASGVPVILEVLPRLLDAVSAAKLTPITLRAALAADAAG
jgi:peptidoglycan/xylan/chitin deacetylase (PgdA/CDA1 family)